MDAISYLKSEHMKFRKTLAAINKITAIKKKKAKFDTLCKELIRHEKMEEKIWYSVLKKTPELRDITNHLINEEKSAMQSIKKFKQLNYDFMWKLKFYKFSHDINHHANEEEAYLFPKVKQMLSKKELNILGTKMRKFKVNFK